MRITEIQRFCMHDGPGIRTTVFLKGCPLRCAWCHNPETQKGHSEIMYYPVKCIGCGACAGICPKGCHIFADGSHIFERESCTVCGKCASVCPANALENSLKEMTVDEILNEILRDRAFYGSTGGVTLSGGEPFMQGEEAIELLQKCRDCGVNTAVETSGFFDSSLIEKLSGCVDLLLWDYKDSDGERLSKYTGAKGRSDVDNLIKCDEACISTVIRMIMVNGVNIDRGRIDGAAGLYASLGHCQYVELLPYHPYGDSKAAALGINRTAHPEWIPESEMLQEFASELEKKGVKVKNNG